VINTASGALGSHSIPRSSTCTCSSGPAVNGAIPDCGRQRLPRARATARSPQPYKVIKPSGPDIRSWRDCDSFLPCLLRRLHVSFVLQARALSWPPNRTRPVDLEVPAVGWGFEMAQLIRRSSSLVAVAVATALVAGCASSSQIASSRRSSPTVAASSFVPSPADPLSLVGSWLLDAPGVTPGTVLRLGDDLSLWSNCGYLMGSWVADHAGLFVGQLDGGDAACMSGVSSQGPTPAWLAKVVAFRLDGAGAVLLDSSGAVVATLRPGGHPTAGPNMLPSLADPPTVSDQLRTRLAPTAALPAGLIAARPSQLVGYWVSAANPNRRGDADLSADGSWQGTDGANGNGGRWSAAPDGQLVVSAGPSTLVGCMPDQCADVDDWFIQASRAAFDGSTLVLLDASGKETGRAVRGVRSTAVPTGSYASAPPATIAVTSASAPPTS